MASGNNFYIGIPVESILNVNPRFIEIAGKKDSLTDLSDRYGEAIELHVNYRPGMYYVYYCQPSTNDYTSYWSYNKGNIFAHDGNQYYDSIDSLPDDRTYWIPRTDETTAECFDAWPYDFGDPEDWGQTSVTVYVLEEPPKTTITLNKAGGSGGTDTVYGINGRYLPSISIPTRTGYLFYGYSKERSGSVIGTRYYNSYGDSLQKWDQTGGTVTLYAKWFNKITYEPYDGFCWAVDEATPGNATTGKRYITIADFSGCASGGALTFYIDKEIEGWSISSDGKTLTIPSGTSVGTYTVTIIVESPSNSSETGYITDDAEKIISIEVKSANVTTITLNKAGGSGGTDTVYGTYDHILPHISIPTRNGFEFSGYSNERSGSEPGELYYNSDGDSTQKWTQIGGTATLYAKWTNTITFNPHDGECWAVDAETPGIATTGPRAINISSPAGCPGGRPTFTTNISGWTVSSTGQTLTIPSGTSVGTRIVTITAESPSSSSDDGYIGETITRTISITIKSPNVTTYSGIYITDRKCDLTPSSSGTYDDSPEANGYGEYYYDTASGKIIRPATGYVKSPWFNSRYVIPASQITIDSSNRIYYVVEKIYAYQKIINPDFTEDWVEIPLTWGGSHTFASLGTTETERKITQFDRDITFTFSGQGGSRNVLTFNLDDYISSPDKPNGTEEQQTNPIYREANKPGPASWDSPDITEYSYSPDPISAGGGTSSPTVKVRQSGTRTWSSGSSEPLTGSLSYSYSISGTGFSINSSTGVVTASDRTNIDGSERFATVTVTVTGGGDKTATKTTSVGQEANTHSDSWSKPVVKSVKYSYPKISACGGTSTPSVEGTITQNGERRWTSGIVQSLSNSGLSNFTKSYYMTTGSGFSIDTSTGVITQANSRGKSELDITSNTATLTLSANGKSADVTATCTQSGNTYTDSWPDISMTCSYPDISACGGTSTPIVNATQGKGKRIWGCDAGTEDLPAPTLSYEYYLTIPNDFTMDSDGVVTAPGKQGQTTDSRSCTVWVYVTGGGGVTAQDTVTCTQSGNTYTDSWPDISMTCSYPDIDACGGTSTPIVNATQGKGTRTWGCNAGTEDLPAPTLSYEYYLTIRNGFTMDSDTGVVTAPGKQGKTTDSRSCTVWVHVTGGGGKSVADNITCTQSGNTYTYSWTDLSVDISYPKISACGGTSTPTVSVTYSGCKRIWGCDAGEETWNSEPTLSYKYSLTAPNGFKVDKRTGVVEAPGKQGKTTHPRSCEVWVDVSGDMYTTKTVTCTQSGNTYIDSWDNPSISAYSYPNNIAASGGTSTPTVTATQSGTRTWDCDEEPEPLSNDRFTYSYSMTTGNGFSINTSTGKITAEDRGTTPGVARTATATVTVTGSDNRQSYKTATCTQDANELEGITFTVGSKTIPYLGTTKGTVTARYTSGSTKDVENDANTSYTDESNPDIVKFIKTS